MRTLQTDIANSFTTHGPERCEYRKSRTYSKSNSRTSLTMHEDIQRDEGLQWNMVSRKRTLAMRFPQRAKKVRGNDNKEEEAYGYR
jgi:hypothetical protein